jgi:hypothetical protein
MAGRLTVGSSQTGSEIPIDAIVNRVASFGYGVVAAPVAQQRLFPKTQASDGDVHCEHRCFNASIYGIFHVETSSGPTGPAVISLVRYFEIQRSGSAELPLAVKRIVDGELTGIQRNGRWYLDPAQAAQELGLAGKTPKSAA